METWKPIPGWETYYEVSNQGRVRSCDRFVVGRHGPETFFKGRILRSGGGKRGHQSVSFTRSGAPRKSFWVHSLVALVFIGPRPPKMQVCHNDGNPKNNCVSNLRYGTQKENSADASKHGVLGKLKGPKASAAKLTWGQVRFLRKNRPARSLAQWAVVYGVSTRTIKNVLKGRCYVETP